MQDGPLGAPCRLYRRESPLHTALPDVVHTELLVGAERCHDGRWFECAAAVGGD